MSIWVCSLMRARALVEYHKPAGVISLLDPQERFPDFAGYDTNTHLRVTMDDVAHDDDERRVAPSTEHIQSIIDFASNWDQSAPLLVHCHAGVSRSSAAAFIISCALNPRSELADIAQIIRRNSLTARPNKRMVAIGDKLLKRRGRMSVALEAIEDSWQFHPEHDVMPYRLDANIPDKGGHL